MILFYGCWTDAEGRSGGGHYFAAGPGPHAPYTMRRRTLERLEDRPENYVPWGQKVDGGLRHADRTEGSDPQA